MQRRTLAALATGLAVGLLPATALAGRDDDSLEPVLAFLLRNVSDPRFTPLLLAVSLTPLVMMLALPWLLCRLRRYQHARPAAAADQQNPECAHREPQQSGAQMERHPFPRFECHPAV